LHSDAPSLIIIFLFLPYNKIILLKEDLMRSNPILAKLGYPADARLAILHTDDVGMCGASLAAYADLLDAGVITSAAVMAPSPWFPAVAEFCREYGDALDIGVHLTLTSEWSGYRWAPLSTQDPGTGLVDATGYLPRTREELVQKAQPDAVRREMEAQVKRALSAGIDATHVDTHMATAFHPRWVQAYIDVALQHGLPLNLPHLDVETALQRPDIQAMGVSASELAHLLMGLQALESRGVPLLDAIYEFPLHQPEGRLDLMRHVFDILPQGITLLINHAAMDTPELRAITPDWQGRVADYQTFTSQEARDVIRESGVHMIGYRPLRDALRSGASES
jgi:predicted glycoside hydrolase/deacetylase ChbG (UPF0249 family)